MTNIILPLGFLFASQSISTDAINVEVYFDRKHVVGDVDSFQRHKFVTIHSANYEILKDGGNELMDYLINDLGVFYGRETGNLTGLSNHYPDNVSKYCTNFKNRYAKDSRFHSLESSQYLSVSGQYRIYDRFVSAAGDDHALAGQNYGDFLSIFLDEACGTGGPEGMPQPEFLEILNEPLWEPIDQYLLWKTTDPNKPTESEEIEILHEHFIFHRESARELHRQFPETKIGGFAEAFPDPELRDFLNWETRWKTFIDSCGSEMDFYSFHLYDFNEPIYKFRKGGNMEAFMDILSHYNYLVWGEEKPFLITEFGARTRNIEDQQSNPLRDWLCSSSISSMMMQFMDRPDMIEGITPFIMAVWSKDWNIFNPDESTAVFTDYVKMYQLWHGVKGTRLLTKTSDLDMQVDAYANGNKTYLILNNLENNAVSVDVTEMGIEVSDVTSTMTKQLHWSSEQVKLDTLNFQGIPATLTLSPMATMVVEYTTADTHAIVDSLVETRYYATTYKQNISANSPIGFSLNDLDLADDGSATLRLGVGRAHGRSLQPEVKMNNVSLAIPADLRGDDQANKETFFGLIEIDVPYNLLQENNIVSVEFPDEGGYVTSVVLRLFSSMGGTTKIEEESGEKFELYPIPATNVLIVNTPDIKHTMRYYIHNLQGQVVDNSYLIGNSIDLKHINPGVYILRLESNDDIHVEQFIKIK